MPVRFPSKSNSADGLIKVQVIPSACCKSCKLRLDPLAVGFTISGKSGVSITRIVCASSANRLPAPPTIMALVSTSFNMLINMRPTSTYTSSSPNGAPNALTTTSKSLISSEVKSNTSFSITLTSLAASNLAAFLTIAVTSCPRCCASSNTLVPNLPVAPIIPMFIVCSSTSIFVRVVSWMSLNMLST